jgi:hypothetical protein
VVANARQANDRLSALAAQFGAKHVDFLEEASQFVGPGVDKKGSLAMAWTSSEKSPAPVFIAFIPVKDFDRFLQPLGSRPAGEGAWSVTIKDRDFLAAKKGKYAVLVDGGQQQLLQEALQTKKNVGDIVAAQRLWKPKQDWGAVVTPAGIQRFVETATQRLDQMQAMFAAIDNPQAQQAVAGMDMYKMLLAGFGKEVVYAAAGLQLNDKGGIRLNARLQFATDGAWSKVAAEIEAAQGDLMAGLPAGDFFMAMGMEFRGAIIKQMMDISIKIMKSMPQLYGEISDEQAQQLTEVWSAFSGWKNMSMAFGTPKAGQPLLSNTVALMRVEDSEQFMKNYVKSIRQHAKIVGEGQAPGMPAMKAEQIKIGELDVVKIRMKMNLPETPGAPALEHMFGPGGTMTAYLAVADKETVAFTYESQENLTQAIAARGKPGLAEDEQLRQTSSLLIQQPHGVFYLSPHGMVQFAKYMIASMPLPPGALDLPAFPESPPVGAAARIDAAGVDLEAVAPQAMVTALAEYVEQIKQLRPRGPN